MIRVPRPLVILLMLALPARPLAAAAQTAGATLLVEARDPSGAAVPGTLVALSSQDTGLERAGTTVDDGTAWIVRLPAGVYTLTAVKGGFKTEVIRGIRVEAAARGRITLLLQLAARLTF